MAAVVRRDVAACRLCRRILKRERFGPIEQIDRWVLREAIGHLSASHAAGRDLMLTINVSGKTMGDATLSAYVAALLLRHPVQPKRLVIEITETAAITNIERARALAMELRSLGCQIALDTFDPASLPGGTGIPAFKAQRPWTTH